MQEDSGAGARTLADTVVQARCDKCGEPPTKIYLAASRNELNVRGRSQGWVILLHAVEAS
jgi:hypothetical protein